MGVGRRWVLGVVAISGLLGTAMPMGCGGSLRGTDPGAKVPVDGGLEPGDDSGTDAPAADSQQEVSPDGGPSDVPADLLFRDEKEGVSPAEDTVDVGRDPLPRDAGADPDKDAPSPDAGSTRCPAFGEQQVLGPILGNVLREASGLAASRRQPGILFSHNDSGDSARFFALRSDGTILQEFRLGGVVAVDIEDISMGPWSDLATDAVFLADIGDNDLRRSFVEIHVVEEPDVHPSRDPEEVSVLASIRLAYPGGPLDAEAFFVDPVTGDFYLVAKEVQSDGSSRLFRKEAPHVASTRPALLLEVGRLPAMLPTAADLSPDGSVLIIRTYFGGVLYFRDPGEPISRVVTGVPCELPPFLTEPQGEAIAIRPDRAGFYSVSEFRSGIAQDLHWTPMR